MKYCECFSLRNYNHWLNWSQNEISWFQGTEGLGTTELNRVKQKLSKAIVEL